MSRVFQLSWLFDLCLHSIELPTARVNTTILHRLIYLHSVFPLLIFYSSLLSYLFFIFLFCVGTFWVLQCLNYLIYVCTFIKWPTVHVVNATVLTVWPLFTFFECIGSGVRRRGVGVDKLNFITITLLFGRTTPCFNFLLSILSRITLHFMHYHYTVYVIIVMLFLCW